MQARIELDMGKIKAGSQITLEKLNRNIAAVMERESIQAENWMKSNAPWKDRTSNARNGLRCNYTGSGDGHTMDFFHSVPYGIWLEIRFEGRNAIIGPALEHFAPRVMSGIEGSLGR